MRIYVAGPMRGYPDFNFPAFDAAAFRLRELGHEVCNPADRDREEYGDEVNASPTGDLADIEHTGFNLREALAWDMAWIAEKADAIYLLDGWEKSKGARAEHALAAALGLEVFCESNLGDEVPPAEPVRCARCSAPMSWHSQKDVAERCSDMVPLIESPEFAKALREDLEAAYGDVMASKGTLTGEVPLDVVTEVLRNGSAYVDGSNNLVTGEVRTVSATGGEKGVKPARLGAVDPLALLRVAEVAGFGAEKYARYNFARGYEWSKSFDALQRHVLAFWNGEDTDPEFGTPHIAHAAWHCLTLLTFLERGIGTDDRLPTLIEAGEL